jgi:hypothetical protein
MMAPKSFFAARFCFLPRHSFDGFTVHGLAVEESRHRNKEDRSEVVSQETLAGSEEVDGVFSVAGASLTKTGDAKQAKIAQAMQALLT